ncbi:MAG TPA: hypothetical protein VK363_00825 [Pyrinomonadaceae bacterium]|nr:hypothetical protein [Pyrinomonadaceae bacterium]
MARIAVNRIVSGRVTGRTETTVEAFRGSVKRVAFAVQKGGAGEAT